MRIAPGLHDGVAAELPLPYALMAVKAPKAGGALA